LVVPASARVQRAQRPTPPLIAASIDNHLKLSVLFVNHAKGRRGTIVPFHRAKVLIGKKYPDPGEFGLMNLPALDQTRFPLTSTRV
jgi:hypothetical protein